MKAVAITEFNSTPSLQELPAPQAAEGQVVVDVEYASVNGMDIMALTGMMQGMLPCEFPITLGQDFAGTVASVGNGVTGLAVGDPVFGLQLPMTSVHDGTLAEQAAVPAFEVVRRPPELDAETAAALGLAGAAAKLAVDAIAPASGDVVLISGASGGVGAFATQLVKARGASVVATAGPDQIDFVKGLGADEVVDYTGDVAAAVRQHHPEGVTAVIHLAGDPIALANLLAPGGRIASTLGFGPDQAAGRDITATPVVTIPSPELLNDIAALVVAGTVRIPITATYRLDEAARAVDDFRAGATGKLVVAVR